MSKVTPAKFYLPGIFLLVLGFGNVVVGEIKVAQYEVVLADLSVRERDSREEKSSVLNRIQSLQKKSDRRAQRLDAARARCDFYRLVVYGGKILSGLGILLVGIAVYIAVRARKDAA